MKVKKQSILEFLSTKDEKSLSELVQFIEVLSQVLESRELELLKADAEKFIFSLERFASSIGEHVNEVQSVDLKDSVYSEIVDNLGISVKGICDNLNESYSRVKYCVDQLFNDNAVSVDKSGYIHRYFPNI